MKKIIGYIIRLTAILLSVIFLTINSVNAAIAVEFNPDQIDPPPCNQSNKEFRFSDIEIQKYNEEISKLRNSQETPEEFIEALNNLLSKYLQKQSISNTETKQSISIQ